MGGGGGDGIGVGAGGAGAGAGAGEGGVSGFTGDGAGVVGVWGIVGVSLGTAGSVGVGEGNPTQATSNIAVLSAIIRSSNLLFFCSMNLIGDIADLLIVLKSGNSNYMAIR